MESIPSAQAILSLIKSCSHLAARESWSHADGRQLVKITSLEQAMAIHSQASQQNLDWNAYVASALVDVYAKCGSMQQSQRVFDSIPQRNVVSWTSLISGYAHNGHGTTALEKFQEMHSRGRASPNSQTFVAALQACAAILEDGPSRERALRVLETCMALHSRAAKLGFDSDVFLANSLVDVYSRCGSLDDAQRVFERMPSRDVVSWNSMMTAFGLHGHPELALDLFAGMKLQGCRPSAQTFAVLLKAAAKLGALQTGKILHAEISRYCCLDHELQTNCLVDFYGKCGRTDDAQRVFDSGSSSGCSIVTWNSLLVGYSRQGDTTRVFALFEALRGEARVALRPNRVTFSALLAACSHAGLVDKGLEHFHSMLPSYGVSPDAQHCRCMVDALGRANRLEEAVEMANKMPSSSVTWITLLGACHKWKNVEVGRLAFDSLLGSREPVAISSYVMMASIYGAAGMWEKKLEIDAMRSKAENERSSQGRACVSSGVAVCQ